METCKPGFAGFTCLKKTKTSPANLGQEHIPQASTKTVPGGAMRLQHCTGPCSPGGCGICCAALRPGKQPARTLAQPVTGLPGILHVTSSRLGNWSALSTGLGSVLGSFRTLAFCSLRPKNLKICRGTSSQSSQAQVFAGLGFLSLHPLCFSSGKGVAGLFPPELTRCQSSPRTTSGEALCLWDSVRHLRKQCLNRKRVRLDLAPFLGLEHWQAQLG